MLISNVLWCEDGHYIPCPFCGAEDSTPHIFEEFDWVTLSIVRCCECGHRFANPCPTAEAAAEHYNSQYLKQKGTALPASLDDVFDPVSIWAMKMRHYAHIFSLLPNLPADIRILDDGCSWGGLLATAKQHYPEARFTGVDLASAAIEFVTGVFGFEGVVGTLIEFARERPGSVFDLVLSSHCLEHSLDPAASMAAMEKLLAPDGLLFITLPNHDSYLRRQMGGYAPAVRGGNHYQFFSEGYLCRALEAVGLEVERSFSSSETSPYRNFLHQKLHEDKDPRAELADPVTAVDAAGEGEFLYVFARHAKSTKRSFV